MEFFFILLTRWWSKQTYRTGHFAPLFQKQGCEKPITLDIVFYFALWGSISCFFSSKDMAGTTDLALSLFNSDSSFKSYSYAPCTSMSDERIRRSV